MPESSPVNTSDAGIEVRTHFVRGRNVLISTADFGDLFVDYYLHLGDHKLRMDPVHDALFKRALAGFTLHCATRPWRETIAWTINFQHPLLNVFLTCDNETGAVAGRVFTENVRTLDVNVFYADVVRPGQPKRRSTVSFFGSDPLAAVEALYLQSEQRPVRVFQVAEEQYCLAVQHPDCDVAWFDGLTTESVANLERTETVALLERRIYRWHCGCNAQRIMEVLAPVMKSDPASLFDGAEKIEIRCPRCAAGYIITREAMEAFVEKPA